MKNRKLLYILIPATAIIWGAIAWNIIRSLKGPADDQQEHYLPFSKNVSDTIEDGYTLLADYHDPFGTEYARPKVPVQDKTKIQTRNASTIRRRTTRTQRIQWPNVEYLGVIMNEKQKVALLKIESVNIIMKTGEVSKELKLLKIYDDSVKLEFCDEKKVYRKRPVP